MDRISTVSESVFKTTTLSSSEAAADLNTHQMHNHVRPTTSEAGVMAASTKHPKKSVEEELELSTVRSSKNLRIQESKNKVKTNNFFKMMNNKTNVLTSPRYVRIRLFCYGFCMCK